MWTMALLVLMVAALLLGIAACANGPSPPTNSPAATQAPTSQGSTSKPASTPTASVSATAKALTFEGKTVTLISPVSPGGGNDMRARIYARFLARYLPGKPTIVVRNMPGGDMTIGSNYAYFSKPDGLTLLGSGTGVLLADLFDKPALKFDTLRDMTALVAAPTIADVYFVKPGLINKPQDITTANNIIYGDTSGAIAWMFVCAKELMNIPVQKTVMSYPGTNDAFRAFIAGEINANGQTSTGYDMLVKPYLDKGDIKLLFQSGTVDESGKIVRHPVLPADLLTITEFYEQVFNKQPSGQAYEAYKSILGATVAVGSPLFLPPATPDEIKKAYWSAAESMVVDPEFLKAMEPLVGTGRKFMVGESYAKFFNAQFGMKIETRDWLRDTLGKYGVVL